MEEPVTISGGWYVVRLLERPAGLGTALLPERLLTLSSCLTQFFPSVVTREMTAATESGELGWPWVWRSCEAARRAAIRFGCATGEFVLIELGVPVDRADDLIAHTRPSREGRAGGFFEHLSLRKPVRTGGERLGWEPLGVEAGGDFHSWLCNSLHDVAKAKLGVKPGPLGLLRTEEDARAVDRMISGGIGAEPVPWFPAVVIRHDFGV